MLDEAGLSFWFRKEILPLERALMGFLRRNWRNHQELVDLRQDIYERVLGAAAENGPPDNARAYLFTTARNHLLTQFRRQQVVSFELVANIAEVEQEFDVFGTDRHLSARDELKRVAEALDLLPARCREVVWLRRIEGCSVGEAAKALNASPSTVEKEFARGMRALTDYLLGGPSRMRRHFSVVRMRKEQRP